MNFEVAAAFKNHFSLILSYILWRLGVSSTQWRDIKRTWIKRTPKAESWLRRISTKWNKSNRVQFLPPKNKLWNCWREKKIIMPQHWIGSRLKWIIHTCEQVWSLFRTWLYNLMRQHRITHLPSAWLPHKVYFSKSYL